MAIDRAELAPEGTVNPYATASNEALADILESVTATTADIRQRDACALIEAADRLRGATRPADDAADALRHFHAAGIDPATGEVSA